MLGVLVLFAEFEAVQLPGEGSCFPENSLDFSGFGAHYLWKPVGPDFPGCAHTSIALAFSEFTVAIGEILVLIRSVYHCTVHSPKK